MINRIAKYENLLIRKIALEVYKMLYEIKHPIINHVWDDETFIFSDKVDWNKDKYSISILPEKIKHPKIACYQIRIYDNVLSFQILFPQNTIRENNTVTDNRIVEFDNQLYNKLKEVNKFNFSFDNYGEKYRIVTYLKLIETENKIEEYTNLLFDAIKYYYEFFSSMIFSILTTKYSDINISNNSLTGFSSKFKINDYNYFYDSILLNDYFIQKINNSEIKEIWSKAERNNNTAILKDNELSEKSYYELSWSKIKNSNSWLVRFSLNFNFDYYYDTDNNQKLVDKLIKIINKKYPDLSKKNNLQLSNSFVSIVENICIINTDNVNHEYLTVLFTSIKTFFNKFNELYFKCSNLKLNTTEIGNRFELKVLDIISSEFANDNLHVSSRNSKIYNGKGYYSQKRKGIIIFDISIETYMMGQSEYSLLTLIECKDYKSAISVSELEEFYTKVKQVTDLNV